MAFGGAVKLTGETEYRKALQNITKDLKSMSTQLKNQSADFASNNKDIDKATASQNELKQSIKEQEQALGKAKGALAQYSVQLQAQTVRHNALSKEYKNAVAELDKIAKESGEASDEYKTQAKAVEKLGVELAESTRNMDESKSAMANLKSEIRNSERAISSAKEQLNAFADEMKDMADESKDARSALEKLEDTIEGQEEKLTTLKEKYKNVVLEQGKSSKEAKGLAKEISSLSKELSQNKSKLEDTSDKADKLDKSLENASDGAEKAKEGFTVFKAVLADLASNVIQSCIDGLKEFVDDTSTAYSKFQAQTGATAEEMEQFKDTMNNLYKNDFGESLQDIGDKMAYIKQVTGETDPTKLGELAENAMTLEDTFGSDFKETVRGVQNLMKHFGITSEEAFDLFAKGSQNGLDYTDELGDNIAEYGGNFKQAGYSAEEYFQLLENGSKGGAYNLDKVNDSINEIKNRLGDGTIEKNIDSFSDSTKKYYKAWQDGNATMKDVINSVVGDITNCTNEQEALTMAQVAFGTMGEDANLDVVKSLTTLGNSYKDVKGDMNEMKQIRYDNVATQFETLGRTIKMDLIAPIAEKLLPHIKKFVDFCINNMGTIKKVLIGVGTTLTAVFAINKVAKFITSIKTLVTTVKGITTAIKGAESATKLFNMAWLTNPVVLAVAGVVAGITALTVVMSGLREKQEEAMRAEWGLTEAQKESVKASEELANKYNELSDARKSAIDGVSAEYGHLSELKDEYNSLIDANGNVKAGYEDRANFILTTLAKSLGVERSEIEKNIDEYGKLSGAIDTLIIKKKAEAILNTGESAYNEAIAQRTEALKQYQEAQDVATEAQKKYNEAQRQSDEAVKAYNQALKDWGNEGAKVYVGRMANTARVTEEAKKAYDEGTKGLQDAESAYVGYNSTIQNYEGLSSAIISGDTTKISEALNNMEHNFITAETGTKNSLERQVQDAQDNYKALKRAVDEGGQGVTQEMVDNAKEMVDKSIAELDKMQGKAKNSTTEAGKQANEGLESQTNFIKATAEKIANTAVDGINSKKSEAEGAGKNYADGFGNGISLRTNNIFSIASGMAQTALNAVRQKLDIHSPSKEASKLGAFFGEGFADGIETETSAVTSATSNLARKALDELNIVSQEMALIGEASGAGFSSMLSRNIIPDVMPNQFSATNDFNVQEQEFDYNLVVGAFKDALSQMKVELDDDEIGTFIDKTVTRAIYT